MQKNRLLLDFRHGRGIDKFDEGILRICANIVKCQNHLYPSNLTSQMPHQFMFEFAQWANIFQRALHVHRQLALLLLLLDLVGIAHQRVEWPSDGHIVDLFPLNFYNLLGFFVRKLPERQS